MLDEFRIENERRKEKGNSIRQAHLLSTDQVRQIMHILAALLLRRLNACNLRQKIHICIQTYMRLNNASGG